MDIFFSALSAVFSFLTAIIACLALNSWKYQMKANVKIKFLDDLTSELICYCGELININDYLKFIVDIEYKSYEVKLQDTYNDESGIVKYIKCKGRERAKLIFGYLDKARLVSSRIESLMIRGQFYRFNQFEELNSAIDELLLISKHIEGIAFVLSNSSFYLPNADIQESLSNVVKIEPDKINECLRNKEQNSLKYIGRYYNQLIL
ncbi:hypothetical protein [Cysteiniphilum halobium]|uniref:hypothetical protein n=1 Tax=Cysteiniphilum halobium TaxID=2219059 RepID=UPI003F86631C